MAKSVFRTVLVIGDNHEELIKKYSADTKVERHVKCKLDDAKKYAFNADDELIPTRAKTLNIGHAIYNPNDEYNERFGFRIAKNRIKTRPFAHLYSEFTGEFNYDTVVAIMDAKAKYIAENSERFITK